MKGRVEELVALLAGYDFLYYVKGESTISDPAYDALRRELKGLDPENTYLSKVSGRSGTIPLNPPMLSLDNALTVTQAVKEFNKLNGRVSGSLKLDGMSCEIIFQNRTIWSATSRGDGENGEDISDKIRTMFATNPSYQDACLKVSVIDARVRMRGELLLPLKHFEEVQKFSEKGYSSPRAFVVSAINSKEADPEKLKYIEFHVFKVVQESREEEFPSILAINRDSLASRIKSVASMWYSMPHVAHQYRIRNIEEMKHFIHYWEEIRSEDNLNVPADGLVFSLDDTHAFNEMGFSTRAPKGAFAYKFSQKAVLTKVRGYKWSMGTTGELTPVIHIDPIKIEGSVISKVNGHNLDNLMKLGASVGSYIKVIKSGSTIPRAFHKDADITEEMNKS